MFHFTLDTRCNWRWMNGHVMQMFNTHGAMKPFTSLAAFALLRSICFYLKSWKCMLLHLSSVPCVFLTATFCTHEWCRLIWIEFSELSDAIVAFTKMFSKHAQSKRASGCRGWLFLAMFSDGKFKTKSALSEKCGLCKRGRIDKIWRWEVGKGVSLRQAIHSHHVKGEHAGHGSRKLAQILKRIPRDF